MPEAKIEEKVHSSRYSNRYINGLALSLEYPERLNSFLELV